MNSTVPQQKFITGSDWLYYKIYTGVNTADTIIGNCITKVTNQLLHTKHIDTWFFIRYTDPDFHIRLRLHTTATEHIGHIISTLYNELSPLIENNFVWKVATDTYTRELNRYGKNTIEAIEQYFSSDSQMIAKSIPYLQSDSQRLIFIISAVDQLLNVFNISAHEKINFVERMTKAFKNEFNANKITSKNLAFKYKNLRLELESFMTSSSLSDESLNLHDLIEQRNTNIEPIVSIILDHEKNNTLQLTLSELLASLIHMLINRGFRSKQRQHEMVVYDFLCKYLKTKMAKENA